MRSACERSAPLRFAMLRFASRRSAPRRSAPLRFAPALRKPGPLRFALWRSALWKSGRMSGFSVTPRVPGSHALLEQCDVLVVRHRIIPVPMPIFSGMRGLCNGLEAQGLNLPQRPLARSRAEQLRACRLDHSSSNLIASEEGPPRRLRTRERPYRAVPGRLGATPRRVA